MFKALFCVSLIVYAPTIRPFHIIVVLTHTPNSSPLVALFRAAQLIIIDCCCCCILLLLVPPHITPIDITGSINAGDSVTLYCTVNKGDNPIFVEWFLDGQPVRFVGGVTVNGVGKKVSVLSIDAVRAEHSGKYTCKATNWAGSAFYTTALSINGLPCFSFYFLQFCFLIFLLTPHEKFRRANLLVPQHDAGRIYASSYP